MRKISMLMLLLAVGFSFKGPQPAPDAATRTIFITGGNFSKPFIKYVIALTKKDNPKICFLPTASADNPNGINNWFETCQDLPLRPYVQRGFPKFGLRPKNF